MCMYINSYGRASAFMFKVPAGCFLCFPAAILVPFEETSTWRLHTELNKSTMVSRTYPRLGDVVYLLIAYNI